MAMQELGEMLRAARQEKGLTLADAEEATRIRQRYLEALEYGDEHGLPAPVYVEGFLRGYAAYLGLPLPAVLDKYRAAQGQKESTPSSLRLPVREIQNARDLQLAAGHPAGCSPGWADPWRRRLPAGRLGPPLVAALLAAFVAALVDAGRCPARGDRYAARRQQPGGHTHLRTIGRCTSSRIHADSRAHGHANRHPGARGHR